MSMDQISVTYKIRNINFLNYFQVKISLQKFMQLHTEKLNHGKIVNRPFLPNHIKIIFKQIKGSKDMYNIINNVPSAPKLIVKWHDRLNMYFDDCVWKQIFKASFTTLPDQPIIWFQYRILNGILGVANLLHKIDPSVPDICRLCQDDQETIVHLFTECQKSVRLWENLKRHIRERVGFNIIINPENIILAYYNTDSNNKPVNAILFTVKKYIFSCAYNLVDLSMSAVMSKLSNMYKDLKYLSTVKNNLNDFNKIWKRWEPFFVGV